MLRAWTVKQWPGERPREWFADEELDLIVWRDVAQGAIGEFQLCYDKAGRERALTWREKRGFRHFQVDGGELDPNRNCSPIFKTDETFDAVAICQEFDRRSEKLPNEVRDFVRAQLAAVTMDRGEDNFGIEKRGLSQP